MSTKQRVLRSRKFVALLAVVISAGAVVSVAAPAVIGRQVYAAGTGLQYRFERVVTDAAGFDSGWHIHPGLVIVQIESGSVQFTQGSCTAKTYSPGETIFEVPWKPARFVATGSATWTTTFIVPASQQLSVGLRAYSPEQPDPCP